MNTPGGLCVRCIHARQVSGARGSLFILCELAHTVEGFPRYPRLPVVVCSGYRAQEEEGDDRRKEHAS
jgi:hypothetical protein